MKKLWYVIMACTVFLILPAVSSEEEAVTKINYIKNIVHIMDLESELSETPQPIDYINLLNSKGFEVSGENLNSAITDKEKVAILNKFIDLKVKERHKIVEGEPNKAIVDEVAGIVSILLEGNGKWSAAEKGMLLGLGDTIKTEKDSFIRLRVGRFGRIVVKENSELTLREISYMPEKDTETILINLAKGEAIADVRDIRKGSRFEIFTPTTIAAVRGTIYSVKVIEEGDKTVVE